MDDYRASVEAARRDRNGSSVLKNWSNDHASVILENLFLAAHTSVKIVSNCLAQEVYDQPRVLAAARSFLEREGVSLELLIECDVEPARPFMTLVREFAAKVEVVRVPLALRDTYSYNFFISDDDCYRFEPDRTQYNATIQFGNPQTTARMLGAFEEIKKLALAPSPGGTAAG